MIVLNKFDGNIEIQEFQPGLIRTAAIIDVETTGLNPMTDKIIELGIVRFDFCVDLGLPVAYDELNQLNEAEILPHITKLTGITQEDVKGKSLNLFEINEYMKEVTLIIAHNASFDQSFVTRVFAGASKIKWVCSLKNIPWKDYGFSCATMQHLSWAHKFYFEGHRASSDCLALLHLLTHKAPDSNETYLKQLHDYSMHKRYITYAWGSSFEKKDLLKQNKFNWNPAGKVWYREFTSNERQEIDALMMDVYDGRPRNEIQEI